MIGRYSDRICQSYGDQISATFSPLLIFHGPTFARDLNAMSLLLQRTIRGMLQHHAWDETTQVTSAQWSNPAGTCLCHLETPSLEKLSSCRPKVIRIVMTKQLTNRLAWRARVFNKRSLQTMAFCNVKFIHILRAVFKCLSKVITWLRLLRLVIGLKDSRQFFNQWEAKRLKTALK